MKPAEVRNQLVEALRLDLVGPENGTDLSTGGIRRCDDFLGNRGRRHGQQQHTENERESWTWHGPSRVEPATTTLSRATPVRQGGFLFCFGGVMDAILIDVMSRLVSAPRPTS